MATMISNGLDVVTFLKQQHLEIKALFEEVRSTHGQQRHDAFYALRRLLAVHETAEEEIVHPAARKALGANEAIVDGLLQEENKAKKQLAAIEPLELESVEFEAAINNLAMDVLAHAQSEERLEFTALTQQLDADELERMRGAVKVAESIAPTRPHPGVESSVGNMLAGPFASMLDRARDMFSGKVPTDREDPA